MGLLWARLQPCAARRTSARTVSRRFAGRRLLPERYVCGGVGFSIGADDYVTKPFSVKVLLERIKALQRRRSQGATNGEVVSVQGIVVDRRRHLVTAAGRTLQLTHSEFRLLETLIRQPGRVFQRSELIDAALGEDALVLERTIDVHIRALRRKLEDDSGVIETVRGVGYRFCEHASQA